MNRYENARLVGQTSLSDLITQKLLSNESIGRSIGSSIGQKMSARKNRLQEKFDPMNIMKFMTGGSSLATVLFGKMTGRSDDDIRHFSGKRKSRSKDPLFSHINSSSVVPLKRDDGITDIVTKIYVLLKKSHERKKREELSLMKEERKIRKQSDENLKSMIAGLIPGSDGKTAPSGGGIPEIFNRLKDSLDNLGKYVLAGGTAALAGAGYLGKKVMGRMKKPPVPPVEEKPKTKKDKTKKDKTKKKGKTTTSSKKKKTTGKGTGKATKAAQDIKDRYVPKEKIEKVEPPKTETPAEKPTAEKVSKSSGKLTKALSKFGKVLGAVGLLTLAFEIEELYRKHSNGEISDAEAKKEAVKIVASGLGGASGAALGGALGSFVPGFGTAIGAIAGGVGGAFFAEDMAEKALNYFENNDVKIPTSLEEIQRNAKQYVKEHGGDQWGTNESISSWFESNTTQKAREFVKEHGGGQWGTDQTKSEWFSGLLTELKQYIDRSVAEQMALTPQSNARYNDAMTMNERLNIDNLSNQSTLNTFNTFNTNVGGKPTTIFNGEQKVRDDTLTNYR